MASVLLRGFVLGFVIAASPGPIFFLCLRRTLARGWLNGLVSGLGVATADGFYAALAAFGIGAVTSVLVGERRWLALIGGAVLVLLGLRILFERPSAAVQDDRHKTGAPAEAANVSGLAWAYLSTLGLTITNPTTIISFAALVATLGIGVSGGLLPPALLVLGVFAGSATWWFVLAIFGAALKARVTPRVVRGISTFSGLAIAALGVLAVVSTLIAV
ncbi:MAG TPA: LysE family transporter [Candidatus Limnocylindria bacterium]|nr:LysE family transporter [Candidatus Limnocylindria bacterium]